MNKKYTINKVVDEIPEALSIYINQLVYSEKRKGVDVITLSLGEAFFEIPQFSFDEIDFVKGYHYSDSLGLPELRKKILEYYNAHYGSRITGIENILVSSGSKSIIYMVMQLVLDPGNEVLIHEPAWLSYQEQAKLAGGRPVFIPYDVALTQAERYITEKTKLLVVNNPNNPAGCVYSRDCLEKVYSICRERGIYILSDEAYSDFTGENEEFVSMSAVAEELEGVFIVNSLSKNMGMSGWRIGYTLAEQAIIMKLLKLNQHIITCAPTVLQMYMAHYFDNIIKITLPQVKDVVQKRKRIADYIDKIGLKRLGGESTFYIFLDVSEANVDTLDFCLFLLLKYGIAAVPGGAYGQSTGHFIRIGVGAEPEERLKRAIDTIKMMIENGLVDVEYVNKRLRKNGFYRFGEADLGRGAN